MIKDHPFPGGQEEHIASLPLQAEERLTVESHLRDLSFLQNELSSVTNQLNQINLNPKHRAVIRSLTSVPSVGKVVATTFHTEMFRPERFNRGEEVASYLGLAPRVRHSGEKHHVDTWFLSGKHVYDHCRSKSLGCGVEGFSRP